MGLIPWEGMEMSPGIAVAIIPEEYYRKPEGVQFRKSFLKREDAVNYAETNGCRVVIACESGGRYDVLYERGSILESTIRFELVVDRGEMVAVPSLMPAGRGLRKLRAAPESPARRPSLKIAWNAVHSRLFA